MHDDIYDMVLRSLHGVAAAEMFESEVPTPMPPELERAALARFNAHLQKIWSSTPLQRLATSSWESKVRPCFFSRLRMPST